MMNKLTQKNVYSLLAVTLCAFAGIFFAFVVREYWTHIQSFATPLPFPASSATFYIFCILAFLLNGLAFSRIFESRRHHHTALALFGTEFFLSLLWLGIFFAMEAFMFGFFTLTVVFILYSFTFAAFRRIDIIAACLTVPFGCLIAVAGLMNLWFSVF